MSLFDDFFILDHDARQHRDIKNLQLEMESLPDHRRVIAALIGRVEQLELLNRTLLEAMVLKGVVTQDEMGVLMQQVDLLDGVEDGKISPNIHQQAPSCHHCGRYVNPQRSACVYCGTAIAAHTKKKGPTRPIRTVTCSGCSNVVPERSTYFATQGVVCEPCFEALDE